MANIGYIRVSTTRQETERQLAGVALDKVFEDKQSGKNTARPGFLAMMEYIREGDTLYVHEMSRLGRNTLDILSTIHTLTERGVSIRFHKEGQVADTKTAMGKAFLGMMAVFADMERGLILERQRDAYDVAKESGRIVARGRSKSIDRTAVQAALIAGESIRGVAAKFGISTQTVQVIKKEMAAAA